jgi:hypothetical protein
MTALLNPANYKNTRQFTVLRYAAMELKLDQYLTAVEEMQDLSITERLR